MDSVRKPLFAWMLLWVLCVFGFSVDATETPVVSAWCLVSAEGRSVRKSQTCPRSYLLLAGSLQAYHLLAGSSVKLIFIGWLLPRTACKLCRAEVEVEVEEGTARMTGTDTDSSITIVGKTHNFVSTFRTERHSDYKQSHYCFPHFPFSSLPLRPRPSLSALHCFDLRTHFPRRLVDA